MQPRVEKCASASRRPSSWLTPRPKHTMADAPTDFAPADFAMPGEVSAPGASSADDYVAEYRSAARTDWEVMAQGLKQRQKANDADKKKGSKAKRAKKDGKGSDSEESDSDSDDKFDDDNGPLCGRRFWIALAAFFCALLIVGSYQAYLWMNPQPLSCSLEVARPQKFKVDVTDFFRPKVSSALQLVLSLKNRNMLRSMLLEQCKVAVFEEETGLKLGSVQQNSLVLAPFSTTSVTLSLQGLASQLPQEEQRRLAAMFLAKKALLLTIVATASSRVSRPPEPRT